MDAAHEPIVAFAARTLAGGGGRVLDLGCGSGALLVKILRSCPGIVPCGVEVEPARAALARARLEPLGGTVFEGDLFDLEAPWEGPRWALVLLMPGRLIEAPARASARLLSRLEETCDRRLAYAYGDWLSRFGGLDPLAAAAGLMLEPGEVDGRTGYPLWRTCALARRAARCSLHG